MIKAVIFDCFGVLTTDLWQEFVVNLPDELTQPARKLNHAYGSGRITQQQFISEIETLTGRQPMGVDGRPNHTIQKNSPLLSYISQLKLNYRIGLLSNIGSNWIKDSFLSETEKDLFDAIVVSHEVGMTKPDERIFRLAASKLRVAEKNCVFVDDVMRNCRAAENVGMRAVMYLNFDQMKRELEQLLSD